MFHTVAFSQTFVQSFALTGFCTPVIDPTVNIQGNNLNIPAVTTNLFGAIPFATAGTAATSAQLQSPSLREVFLPDLNPKPVSATTDAVPTVFELFDNPIPLVYNEGVQYQDNAFNATPTGQHGAVMFLSDGARTPVIKSKIYTMRCTATVQQVVNSWVTGSLTFGQSLPVGKYDVVGMRAEAAGLLAARLVFVGASAVTRPGCPGNASAVTQDVFAFRMGRLGVWGTFDSVTPPSVEVLGGTANAQTIYLDLVPR